MKTLVVFYSLGGNTEFVAEILAKKLQADIVKLETVKPFPNEGFKKYVIGGMTTVFKMKPKLANRGLDLAAYDNIVLGTPVWAGSYASPLHTFIRRNENKGKKIAIFLCSGGDDVEKCFAKLKNELPGNSFAGEIDFIEPLSKDKNEVAKKAVSWAGTLGL